MIAQKRGVIVSLASVAGKIGSRANLPYNASKAAVISMTKASRWPAPPTGFG
jgi:NAD(P)-dependent dehydrogenase (short-subunit alcohol dehydrogenase family)